MIKILREAGYDAASAKTAYGAIPTYTVGFRRAGGVTGRVDATTRDQQDGRDWWPLTSPKQFRPAGCATCSPASSAEAGPAAQ